MTVSGTVSGTAAASPAAGSSTTARLLDAASAAMAAEGFEGMSLRAVMRAAGANPAAIHYHFGSREELGRRVLDRVLEPIQRSRLERLEQLELHAPLPGVESLVEALVRPDFEIIAAASERAAATARLIGAIYARPGAFVQHRVEESFRPVAVRFMEPLSNALPYLTSEELAWRVRWFVFGPLGALLSDPDFRLDPGELDGQVARFVTVASAALAAEGYLGRD